jgi:hypothetical protein
LYYQNTRVADFAARGFFRFADNLAVSGGTVAIEEGGKEQHRELVGEFVLNLSTMTWRARP